MCPLSFLNFSSLIVKTLLLIGSLWMILPWKIITITLWLYKVHRVSLWLGLRYVDFGSESKSIVKLCLNKEQLWPFRIILSSVHTQRNSGMCFLLHNHGIVGKEGWAYSKVFSSPVDAESQKTHLQSKKCAVFCEETPTVRSCEVGILNCKQLLSLCTPCYKPACSSWTVRKWDTFVTAVCSVRQLSLLLFHQCKLMRGAKAGTCSYQQFQPCSTVGSGCSGCVFYNCLAWAAEKCFRYCLSLVRAPNWG